MGDVVDCSAPPALRRVLERVAVLDGALARLRSDYGYNLGLLAARDAELAACAERERSLLLRLRETNYAVLRLSASKTLPTPPPPPPPQLHQHAGNHRAHRHGRRHYHKQDSVASSSASASSLSTTSSGSTGRHGKETVRLAKELERARTDAIAVRAENADLIAVVAAMRADMEGAAAAVAEARGQTGTPPVSAGYAMAARLLESLRERERILDKCNALQAAARVCERQHFTRAPCVHAATQSDIIQEVTPQPQPRLQPPIPSLPCKRRVLPLHPQLRNWNVIEDAPRNLVPIAAKAAPRRP